MALVDLVKISLLVLYYYTYFAVNNSAELKTMTNFLHGLLGSEMS